MILLRTSECIAILSTLGSNVDHLIARKNCCYSDNEEKEELENVPLTFLKDVINFLI